MDKYQERYSEHQRRKKETLSQIVKDRHSNRVYSDELIDEESIKSLLLDSKTCPSSCNRQAINVHVVNDRDKKALLGGLLVGGVGWVHRASHILLIFADPIAYKAGDEIKFMPYLDAGCVVQQLYLSATIQGLKCCYINPNVRELNKEHFKNVFSGDLFCGAFAIGLPPKEEGIK